MDKNYLVIMGDHFKFFETYDEARELYDKISNQKKALAHILLSED